MVYRKLKLKLISARGMETGVRLAWQVSNKSQLSSCCLSEPCIECRIDDVYQRTIAGIVQIHIHTSLLLHTATMTAL